MTDIIELDSPDDHVNLNKNITLKWGIQELPSCSPSCLPATGVLTALTNPRAPNLTQEHVGEKDNNPLTFKLTLTLTQTPKANLCLTPNRQIPRSVKLSKLIDSQVHDDDVSLWVTRRFTFLISVPHRCQGSKRTPENHLGGISIIQIIFQNLA